MPGEHARFAAGSAVRCTGLVPASAPAQRRRQVDPHASVGLGSGRFANRSPHDIAEGKGEQGTRVFGNAAIEVQPDLNLILEWSGINLHAGASYVVQVYGQSVGLTLGLVDLTGYSGDGARLVGGAALGVSS